MDSRHILIIGGMGPQASLYAHSLLIKGATQHGAHENQGYPRITHLSVNVKDFISQPTYREEARAYILQCLREIDVTSVDAAFIACNTAHTLAADIVEATGLPLVSLMDVTKAYIDARPEATRVGVLSTPSTAKTKLYQHTLGDAVEIVGGEEANQGVEGIIRGVIAGDDESELAAALQEKVNKLKAAGAQHVILGCTELSLLGAYLEDEAIIDPLKLTVDKILSEKVQEQNHDRIDTQRSIS